MNGFLVDSNVILDIFLDDPNWGDWSEATLALCSDEGKLFINPIIYTEVSIGFKRIEELEAAIQFAAFELIEIPREALFLAGKAFLQYRRKNKGKQLSTLPDFFIGAQAAVMDLQIITRDNSRYRTYFPTVELVIPE